ncbi:MAG: hypothetical protein KAX05_12455 [Bacteroidales bacterium]|nr:hypothetical protein [Bacteroidales bacterium]
MYSSELHFKKFPRIFFFYSILLVLPYICYAQYRPSLLFREDWKEIPPAIPVTQEHVANENLILNLYGAGRDSIKKSNHDHPVDDPYYIWSGMCNGNWAVTLKHKKYYADLTEFAKVNWRSKQSGFRKLHLILKLADGTWLISDLCDDQSKDWRICEFNIMDMNWYSFNIERISEEKPIKNPDLSKVDEIGFTDLMRGGRSSACSRLDWIEVYGKPVERNSVIH